MTEAPKILLAHHLKTLKLPTWLVKVAGREAPLAAVKFVV